MVEPEVSAIHCSQSLPILFSRLGVGVQTAARCPSPRRGTGTRVSKTILVAAQSLDHDKQLRVHALSAVFYCARCSTRDLPRADLRVLNIIFRIWNF